MRRCVLSELDVLKPFPQTEQTCGFSPANQLVKVIDKLIIRQSANINKNKSSIKQICLLIGSDKLSFQFHCRHSLIHELID